MAQSEYTLRQVFSLAYQSFAIVFAALGTSPIYVYKVTLSGKLLHHQAEEVTFGVFSLIFWTLTLVSLCKHALCLLTVDDNGEGGIFALYALLCRHAKLGLLPNIQAADEELTPYRNPCQTSRTVPTPRIRRSIERLTKRKTTLLVLVMLGASMVVIMGVLTPAITMLSSIEGIRVQKSLDRSHLVVVTCAALVGLFIMQHRGTYWAAFIFPPIVIVWMLSIAAIGIYNIIIWNPNIYKALSPYYIHTFFQHTGRLGWVSLGGILLCLAGSGAIFADVGHFPASSMRVAFFSVTYPCLVIQYMGQAAFLSRNFSASDHSFYASIPDPFFWPVYVLAILVAIIASQSIISASCSVVKQSHALGCFPRVKILHTSRSILGRTFIPEINWILMILSLSVIVGFRDTKHIAYAYGIAFVTTEHVITWLMSLVINLVYHKNLLLSIAFFMIFGSIEIIYFSSAFLKIIKGGWFSLLLAAASMTMMFAWHYASRKKYLYDLHNKVPMKWIFTLGPSLGVVRVPGIALFYTELATGIPSTFSHFLANLPAFYEVVAFICVKTVPIPYVPHKERYLVGRIGPKSYRMYRCIVRNGYKDVPQKEDDLENDIIMSIAEFIQLESEDFGSLDHSVDGRMAIVRASDRFGRSLSVSASTYNRAIKTASTTSILGSSKSPALLKLQATYEQEADQLVHRRAVQFQMLDTNLNNPQVKEELLQLVKANDAGVTYIIGHSHIRAKSNSSRLKKFAVNAIYSFFRKNCRRPMVALNIPQVCLIEVGMNYHV